MATAVIALVAAFVGLRQLRKVQALRLNKSAMALAVRREQAQPYVAVFMEPLAVDPKFQELVIKNFGTTAAFNIRVESELRGSPTLAIGTEVAWALERELKERIGPQR